MVTREENSRATATDGEGEQWKELGYVISLPRKHLLHGKQLIRRLHGSRVFG